jgi:hypothetical protein
MNKLLALAFALISTSALAASTADLSTQMQNIVGDWRLPGQAVIRIQKQSDQSVKLYWCDESTYLNSSNKFCTYSFIKIYDYRSDLDGFFAASVPGKYCAESLQVSAQYTSQLDRLLDPYNEGHCDCTGTVQEATKL